MSLQYSEEKLEKDTATFKEKIHNLESQLSDQDHRVEELNSMINSLRNSEKDSMGKIQKMDIQGLKNNEKIEKVNK